MNQQLNIRRSDAQVNGDDNQPSSSKSLTSKELLQFEPASLKPEQRAKVTKHLASNPSAVESSDHSAAWNAAVLTELNGAADREALAPSIAEETNGKVTGIYALGTDSFTLEVEKPNGRTTWGTYSTSGAKAALVYHGVPTDDATGLLIDAKHSPSKFLGELTISGKQQGIQTGIGGNPEDPEAAPKYLSPRGPALHAEPGEHSFYSENIKSLCGGNEKLYHRLFYTVYRALKALESGTWEMFPIVVIMGSEGVGKSLFTALLARACGAYEPGAAGPYLLAADGGGENKDLVSSFLWDCNDLTVPARREGVTRFHGFLKSVHADENLLLKGLYCDKLRTNPLRMIVIGLNDDASSQSIIPPLDAQSGFQKKVIAFRASPMSHLISDRRESTKALCNQAAAFRHYILNDWYVNEFPKHQDIVSSERVGVSHYADSDLADDALLQSYEADVFSKICSRLGVERGTFFCGSYKTLTEKLGDMEVSSRVMVNLRRALPHLVDSVKPITRRDSMLWVIREGPDSIMDTNLSWECFPEIEGPYKRSGALYAAAQKEASTLPIPSHRSFQGGAE